MPFNSSDVYTVDGVVSDIPGTRKSVVNHLISVSGLNGLESGSWNSVRYSFWNDGGVADENGFRPLLSDHVISLKNVVMRIMLGMNQSASGVTEITTFHEGNIRIIEYKKNMEEWEPVSILVSNYGNYTAEHDCVINHGGFENYLFKAGYAYMLQYRIYPSGLGAMGAASGTIAFTCDLYESF